MSCCQTCLSFTGIRTFHTPESVCPVLSSLRCRRCHCRGHLAADCGGDWPHWERPTHLEDLIPADVRSRWGITSATDLVFEVDRGVDASERKVEIEVSNNDKKMRDFMKEHAIDTTHRAETNLQRIREWAMSRGFRLRIV